MAAEKKAEGKNNNMKSNSSMTASNFFSRLLDLIFEPILSGSFDYTTC